MSTTRHTTAKDRAVGTEPLDARPPRYAGAVKWLARLDDRRWLQQAVRVLVVVGAVLLLLDLVVDIHAKVPGEGIFGFYSVLGTVAVVVVVWLSRWLGERFRKPESYYRDAPFDARGAGIDTRVDTEVQR